MSRVPLSCLMLAALFALSPGLPAYAEEIIVRNGLVKFVQQAQVPAREPGALVQVTVREGDRVEQGQSLARLDDHVQVLALQKAELELQLAQREAEFGGLVDRAVNLFKQKQQAAEEHEFLRRITRRQAENEIKVAAHRKQLEVAQNELDRALKARNGFANSVSDSEIDARKLAVSHADLSLQQAIFERELDALKADAEDQALASRQLEIAGAEIERDNAVYQRKLAEQAVRVKENALRTAQASLERRFVIAPLTGVVVELQRQSGEWMEPGETLVRIVNLERLRVEGFVTAAQGARLAPGMPVRVSAGEKGPLCEGVITFISPEIDPVNQEVRIWAEFDNSGHPLLPGMRPMMTVETAAVARK